MKVRMNGRVVTARLDAHYADTAIGHPVIVLETGTIVEPSFATIRGMSLVEASAVEREALRDAGYELADDASKSKTT